MIISLDGLAPEGGEPQLWFIRELLTGLSLRSGWLSRFDQITFAAFLQPLSQLPWPILAVLSDKQKGLVPAVTEVLPDTLHQFCQAHYLKNLAAPLAAADSTFNVELRQAVRQEAGLLIRTEQPTQTDHPADVLTMTGLLPDQVSASAKPTPSPAETDANPTPASTARPLAPEPAAEPEPATSQDPDATVADEVVSQLLRHTRYLLTLKGRPPFCLAGSETYQRLQAVVAFSAELLAHRHDTHLAHLHQGLRTALLPFTAEYQDLQQGITWLREIDRILEAADEHPITSEQVAQRLRSYLDDLLNLSPLSPLLDAFRRHLDKVSTSYWPGLFHCYALAELPRTNNDLESHFRDSQRRLLRTTGQKGQTRRTLHRLGAWELLPRPATEAARLVAFCQVSPDHLTEERQRLLQHRERFRLQTRSIKQTKTQFGKLRQQWLALAATSTG